MASVVDVVSHSDSARKPEYAFAAIQVLNAMLLSVMRRDIYRCVPRSARGGSFVTATIIRHYKSCLPEQEERLEEIAVYVGACKNLISDETRDVAVTRLF